MLEIMLVEDDEVDTMTIQRLFKKNEVINTLNVAKNGIEALAILNERDHEILKENTLIILDYHMLKMNGLEFLNHLQENYNFVQIPVIITMNFSEIRFAMEKCHSNIVGHLVKPIDFPQLTQILKFDLKTRQLSLKNATKIDKSLQMLIPGLFHSKDKLEYQLVAEVVLQKI